MEIDGNRRKLTEIDGNHRRKFTETDGNRRKFMENDIGIPEFWDPRILGTQNPGKTSNPIKSDLRRPNMKNKVIKKRSGKHVFGQILMKTL